MPVLNFPSDPSLNQVYSFNGKTWIWNGQGWALSKSGAINGVVIGNVAPAAGTFTTLQANSVSAIGNVTGNYILGNGALLTGVITSVANINSGNSNIAISTPGGDITVGVHGVANVATFTTDGIDVQGNVTADYFFGNVVGNITGNIVAPGANTQVIFNDAGQEAASAGFTFNKVSNIVSVTGNVVAAGFTGSGVGLSSTMSDKGGDTNNWNTLLEMGTYTVNRVNWGGVTGPPLDSQVYVGLLTVSASSAGAQAVQQVFAPGTVDPTNIKVQWIRNYWSGSWTPWVKMVNDVQNIDGGSF